MDYMIKPDMMPMFGCDFGHSASPTVLLRIWFLENKCFYIDYEAVEYNIKLSDMPSLFAGTHPEGLWNNDNYYKGIPESRKHTIICDNARPETWQMLKDDYGFQTEPCDKHSTSVIDGIEFLNSYQTYIHPRCVHTQKDFIGFKFKRDPKTERVTRVLIDEYKDAPDAFRYGTEHLRKKIMGDRKIGEGNTDFLLP